MIDLKVEASSTASQTLWITPDRVTEVDCQNEGCSNKARYYLGDQSVCSTCKSRHVRSTQPICARRGCSGIVRFGLGQHRQYCRSDEIWYLLERACDTDDTLAELPSQIAVVDGGCWKYREIWGEGFPRPTRTSGGLKWNLARFLYVWFFGGHRGGRELHHMCGNRWCVNPGHVDPVTGPRNREYETDSEDMYIEREVQAFYAESDPNVPDEPIRAADLARFTAALAV